MPRCCCDLLSLVAWGSQLQSPQASSLVYGESGLAEAEDSQAFPHSSHHEHLRTKTMNRRTCRTLMHTLMRHWMMLYSGRVTLQVCRPALLDFSVLLQICEVRFVCILPCQFHVKIKFSTTSTNQKNDHARKGSLVSLIEVSTTTDAGACPNCESKIASSRTLRGRTRATGAQRDQLSRRLKQDSNHTGAARVHQPELSHGT